MRHYWKFTFYLNDKQKTRYFYGTESTAERRASRTTGEKKNLVKLSKSHVSYLKTEKNVRFIDL